jgi:hypothetical protein
MSIFSKRLLISLFDVVLRMHLVFSSEISFKTWKNHFFWNFPNIKEHNPTSDSVYQKIEQTVVSWDTIKIVASTKKLKWLNFIYAMQVHAVMIYFEKELKKVTRWSKFGRSKKIESKFFWDKCKIIISYIVFYKIILDHKIFLKNIN